MTPPPMADMSVEQLQARQRRADRERAEFNEWFDGAWASLFVQDLLRVGGPKTAARQLAWDARRSMKRLQQEAEEQHGMDQSPQ